MNEIDTLVDFFHSEIGEDLQTYTTDNVLWHTGQPCNMRDPSQYKYRQPWVYNDRVAEGTSAPEGMKPEGWEARVRHILGFMPYQ